MYANLSYFASSSNYSNNEFNFLEESGKRKLVPAHIENLSPYKPGRPSAELCKELGIKGFINLASNENSLGPPKGVKKAINEVLAGVHCYPDASASDLRNALAAKYNVKAANITVGNGSESIISNILRTFLHGSNEVLTSEGTFVGVSLLVKANGSNLVTVPLKNYCFDLEAIANAINKNTKIIYLCNPNNPTGQIISQADFETFIKKVPPHVLVILDEAYYEFAKDYSYFPDSLNYRYDNVLTLRTFSKAYGLAGLRLGYGMAHECLIDYIHRIKLPFEPNTLAQVAGLTALKDDNYLERTLKNNNVGKEYLKQNLDMLGIEHIPTYANFIMINLESENRVNNTYNALLKQGIVIRPLKAFGLPTCMRITIGLPMENQKLIKAFKKII